MLKFLFHYTRVLLDHTLNTPALYGHQFIRKTLFLYKGDDKEDGNFTYISTLGCSVIDYCLCSGNLIHSVENFQIGQRGESKHFPIITCLNILNIDVGENRAAQENTYETNYKNYNIPLHLRESFQEKMSNEFNNNCIHDLCDELDNFNADINQTLASFIEVLKTVGKDFERKPKHHRNKQPKWFDEDCYEAKRLKYRSLRKYRQHKSDINLQRYIDVRNDFKSMCKKKQKAFDEKRLDDLVGNINDSRSFWSRLKSTTTRGRRLENNITTEEWVDHFEKVLNPENVNIGQDDNNNIELEVDGQLDEIEDFIFNTDISEDEIRLAVKRFRKGKKPGPDCLLPEFFIYGINVIMHVLVKLFNRLFVTGEYPDSWCESLIVVIHKKGDINNTDNYWGISLQNVLSKLYC